MTTKTNSRIAAYVAVFVLVALTLPGAARAALVNGDFSEPFSTGWTAESRDFVGNHRFINMKDGGIKIRKTMCGFARLSQDIDLEDTDMVLTSRVSFRATANKPGYHAYSALAVGYLDKEGAVLGETRYFVISGQRGKPSTPTRHYVPVQPGEWQDVSLNLKDELRANLTGVIPAKVTGLRVTLESFGSNTSAC